MKKLLNFFSQTIWSMFKLIEEHDQFNIITDISLDSQGLVRVHISPLNSKESTKFYPYKLIKKPLYTGFLRKKDIRYIRALLLTEGDIFINEVEFEDNTKLLKLQSLLTGEEWAVRPEQLNKNPDILRRLNKRFYIKEINTNHNN